jgi:hypothetical protein
MPTSFTLVCRDSDKGKGEWQFQPHENGMNVFDPDGQVVFWFSHAQASQYLSPPSFWLDVKDIVLSTDKDTTCPGSDGRAPKAATVRRYGHGTGRVSGLRKVSPGRGGTRRGRVHGQGCPSSEVA